MVIRFLCPNGHKIHCPDEQAGRAAKCPKCGVRFRIPDPSEIEEDDSEVSDSEASQAQLSDSGEFLTGSGAGVETVDEDQEIEFLCPNGHRLHGPASLQGRPGQCPECGARFRIPSYDEIPDEEEEEAEEQISVTRTDRQAEQDVALEELDEAEQDAEEELAIDDTAGLEQIATETPTALPLVGLFLKLWKAKPPGATVELHLEGGEVITPGRFAATLSQGSHGLFGTAESDETYTLTAVAWASVTRVVVRGMNELPDEMAK